MFKKEEQKRKNKTTNREEEKRKRKKIKALLDNLYQFKVHVNLNIQNYMST